MRYFKNREQAGHKIAQELKPYAKDNCAVVSLSPGGVLIGQEVAKTIHASLYLLMMEKVRLPGEVDPLAVMSSAGTFTYNDIYSTGQLEEFKADYRSLIDQERIKTFHHLNRIVGKSGVINKKLLKRHTVILVSDGLSSGLSLSVAADFMKSIAVKKIIIATPIASVPAVDKMHALTDKIICLEVIDNYITTEHYYEDNTIPSHEEIIDLIQNITLKW